MNEVLLVLVVYQLPERAQDGLGKYFAVTRLLEVVYRCVLD